MSRNRPGVRGNVLTSNAVTAGHATDKPTSVIGKGETQTINLELGHILDGRPVLEIQSFVHPGIKRPKVVD